METVETTKQKREASHGLNSNLDGQSDKADIFSDELEKSAVQAIIESTPELDMELGGLNATSTPTKSGVENLAFDRNTDSLFEELSSAGNDLVGDVDEGATCWVNTSHSTYNYIPLIKNISLYQQPLYSPVCCHTDDFSGMGREVEHLIQENVQLLETKNALNVVKNDLIAQLDDLTCEKEVLQGELTAIAQAKTKLEEKNKELEESSKKRRAHSQRKRFTRVEMARVLMERNQASKENPALPEKKKSSLWQLAPAESVVSRREQKRAQYQQVKAHVQKEDGRVQAYGWSLPKKYRSAPRQRRTGRGEAQNLPVPVFLRPLDEKDASMKLWCAAGVHLSGGRTRDGGSIVGASVFYSDASALRAPRTRPRAVWTSWTRSSRSQRDRLPRRRGGVCELRTLQRLLHLLQSHPRRGGPAGGITVLGCTAEGSTAPQSPVKTNGDSRAEEATEAEEGSPTAADRRGSLRGVYTEHIFTDPLGADSTHSDGDVKNNSESGAEEQDLSREEAQRMSSVQPTMWLGAQNGCVYVHSSVAQRKRCLHSVKLKDSVLGIVHVKGRVLVGLSDGTIAIFHRGSDGQWDLTNYHLINLGRPHSIRCMSVVHDRVWCGSKNKIYVVQPKAMKIEKCFDAHPRKDSQVRLMAWDGDGIWVSIRLDSTLRLFHAHTHQHLQDVDIEPYVSKMLGTGKLGFSFVRITALTISCQRLWIGTGNGVIISIPLTDTINKTSKSSGPGSVVRVYGDESGDKVHAGTSVPYCSMAHAQLCFHGHRDAVKFFTAVPGQAVPSAEAGDKPSDPSAQEGGRSTLVMSGGEGYIDFRMGDEEGEGGEGEELQVKLQPKAERSHLIVWQVLHNSD
ncbi:hypothetical protein WMY93_010241 [Mugilogobius chulae]|uniref:JNK-interacting protein leucine zipper II domain-containing protein n=1 Tax=Mugilogobius chulae TaxID=88201 RepID=A0AAW0PAI3_9GOBI